MARCPDCNKFVSYGEIRLDEIEVEASDSELRLSGPIYLTCGECGTDLRTAELEETLDITDEFPEPPEDVVFADLEYEVTGEPDITEASRTETTDRKGKPMKSRYWKNFYGAEATVEVVRRLLDKEGKAIEGTDERKELTIGAECQASFFEEC